MRDKSINNPIVMENPTTSKAEASENPSLLGVGVLPPYPGEYSQTTFAKFVHEYIRSYIPLADQKASFNFIAISTLLGFVAHRPIPSAHILAVVHVAAVALLLASAICSLLTIFPRSKETTEGLIHWRQIRLIKPEAYAERVVHLNQEVAAREFALHTHVLSKICEVKYRWLRLAMGFALAGIMTYFALYFYTLRLPVG